MLTIWDIFQTFGIKWMWFYDIFYVIHSKKPYFHKVVLDIFVVFLERVDLGNNNMKELQIKFHAKRKQRYKGI